MLLDAGVGRIGDPAVSCGGDRRSQLRRWYYYSTELCRVRIVVNKNAERFYDEGEDIWLNAMLSGGGWWRSNPTRSPISCSIIRC